MRVSTKGIFLISPYILWVFHSLSMWYSAVDDLWPHTWTRRSPPQSLKRPWVYLLVPTPAWLQKKDKDSVSIYLKRNPASMGDFPLAPHLKNTRYWTSVDSMLSWCRRRLTSFKPTLGQCFERQCRIRGGGVCVAPHFRPNAFKSPLNWYIYITIWGQHPLYNLQILDPPWKIFSDYWFVRLN